jgi:dihydroneopterin aldolase
MDKVFINNLQVETIIGIFDWEREVRQVVSIDLEMEFDNKKAAKSDDIKDALDYKKVGKRVSIFIERSQYKLVERLAEQIAKLVLKEFPVSSVIVSVMKPGAMRGSESVGIRITRP